jgi:predicted acyl esterase
MSHLFRAGKQIKVEISAIDIPTDIETYDVMWHVCKSRTCTHKIYSDGRYPSKASLPVIPKNA